MGNIIIWIEKAQRMDTYRYSVEFSVMLFPGCNSDFNLLPATSLLCYWGGPKWNKNIIILQWDRLVPKG